MKKEGKPLFIRKKRLKRKMEEMGGEGNVKRNSPE